MRRATPSSSSRRAVVSQRRRVEKQERTGHDSECSHGLQPGARVESAPAALPSARRALRRRSASAAALDVASTTTGRPTGSPLAPSAGACPGGGRRIARRAWTWCWASAVSSGPRWSDDGRSATRYWPSSAAGAKKPLGARAEKDGARALEEGERVLVVDVVEGEGAGGRDWKARSVADDVSRGFLNGPARQSSLSSSVAAAGRARVPIGGETSSVETRVQLSGSESDGQSSTLQWLSRK